VGLRVRVVITRPIVKEPTPAPIVSLNHRTVFSHFSLLPCFPPLCGGEDLRVLPPRGASWTPKFDDQFAPRKGIPYFGFKELFLPIWKPLILVTSKRVRTLPLTPGRPYGRPSPICMAPGQRHLGAGYGARPLPSDIQHLSATVEGHAPLHTHFAQGDFFSSSGVSSRASSRSSAFSFISITSP